jgi:hypothetical protein
MLRLLAIGGADNTVRVGTRALPMGGRGEYSAQTRWLDTRGRAQEAPWLKEERYLEQCDAPAEQPY